MTIESLNQKNLIVYSINNIENKPLRITIIVLQKVAINITPCMGV